MKKRRAKDAQLLSRLRKKLAAWFDKNRRDLPWRRTRDPYAIWLSEVMLQQTRVRTVEEYFARFLGTYPTVADLANAELDDVLRSWSGLGYYRRARALHAGAREVVEKYGGSLPRDAATLREISGIGPYTAGAIASIAFDESEPLVDGNVARVLSRIFALTCDVRTPAGSRQVWSVASELVPESNPGKHNEALMELGATVCIPGEPRCRACPVATLCEAHARGLQGKLPIMRKKRPPRAIDMFAIVARRDARLLLGHRKEGGLFGGLWEPPMVELAPSEALGESLERILGAAPTRLSVVAEQTHLLTHRKLKITIATAEIAGDPVAPDSSAYDRLEWRRSTELDLLGMSSLARKILLACPGST